MNELLEKGQIISIVPQDFRKSNKGKILDIRESYFSLEVMHTPEGINAKSIMEFYSQTKNGMLYFSSPIAKVDGNVLVVTFPKKHRFLQRRTFTRTKFIQDVKLVDGDKTYQAKSFDLSAGGVKLKSSEPLDLDKEYDLNMTLINDSSINCKYEPLKIEKNDDGFYTIAGRFKDLLKTDRMKIIQFCMRKDIENANR